MSDDARDTSILILRIIGVVLIGVTMVLGMIALICAFGWESPNMSPRCADGSLKEVAFTVIAAAGALWAASAMKGSKP